MKAEALTDSTTELPKARIVVELQNGERVIATGFVIRKSVTDETVIIIKTGKTSVSIIGE